jgi:hypothetical protein
MLSWLYSLVADPASPPSEPQADEASEGHSPVAAVSPCEAVIAPLSRRDVWEALLERFGHEIGGFLGLRDSLRMLQSSKLLYQSEAVRRQVLGGVVWTVGVPRPLRPGFWARCAGVQSLPDAERKVDWAVSQAELEWTRSGNSVCPGMSAPHDGSGLEGLPGEIERDIPRTFPQHPWVRSDAGKACLYVVLRATSLLRPAVGYCQGENFVAASLLIVLSGADGIAMCGEAPPTRATVSDGAVDPRRREWGGYTHQPVSVSSLESSSWKHWGPGSHVTADRAVHRGSVAEWGEMTQLPTQPAAAAALTSVPGRVRRSSSREVSASDPHLPAPLRTVSVSSIRLLCALIDRYGCALFWATDISGMSLLSHQHARVVSEAGSPFEALLRTGLSADLQATHWLLPLLSTALPLHTLAHVWDAFFLFGWTALFRAIVAVSLRLGPDVATLSLPQCMDLLRFWRSVCPHDVEAGLVMAMPRGDRLSWHAVCLDRTNASFVERLMWTVSDEDTPDSAKCVDFSVLHDPVELLQAASHVTVTEKLLRRFEQQYTVQSMRQLLKPAEAFARGRKLHQQLPLLGPLPPFVSPLLQLDPEHCLSVVLPSKPAPEQAVRWIASLVRERPRPSTLSATKKAPSLPRIPVEPAATISPSSTPLATVFQQAERLLLLAPRSRAPSVHLAVARKHQAAGAAPVSEERVASPAAFAESFSSYRRGGSNNSSPGDEGALMRSPSKHFAAVASPQTRSLAHARALESVRQPVFEAPSAAWEHGHCSIAGAIPSPGSEWVSRVQHRIDAASRPFAADATALMGKIHSLIAATSLAEADFVETHLELQDSRVALEGVLRERRAVTSDLESEMQLSSGESELEVEASLKAHQHQMTSAVETASKRISSLDDRVKMLASRWKRAVWKHTMSDTRLEELSQARAALQDQLRVIQRQATHEEDKILLEEYRLLCREAVSDSLA